MKRLILVAALLAVPTFAAAQAEQRLTTADLRAMAARGALLCERWDAAAERCDGVYRWNVVNGELTETRLEAVSNTPPIDTAFQYPVAFRDDQACVTMDANATSLLVMANGRELTSEEAAPIRARLDTVYAPVNGQTVCTAYFRDAGTGGLRAEVSVGGARRAAMDTSFRVLESPPLPRLHPVRQPWSAQVVRTVAAIMPTEAAAAAAEAAAPQAAASAPAAAIPAQDAAAAPSPAAATPAPAPSSPVMAEATPPPPQPACQADNGRMSRLRRWLRIGGDDCPAAASTGPTNPH